MLRGLCYIMRLFILFGLLACDEDVTNIYEENYNLKLSRDTIFFDIEGGMKSVEIKTNQEWWQVTKSEDTTWYSVKEFRDADGYEMLTITLGSSEGFSTREAKLTIDAGGVYSEDLYIIQRGSKPLYSELFTDFSCSELKPEVKQSDIDKIEDELYRKLATELLNGTYEKGRILSPIPLFSDRDELKINSFSLLNHATGIYFEKGVNQLVLCGDYGDKAPELMVIGESGSLSYQLMEGENVLDIVSGGKVYINNSTNVNINITGGDFEGKIPISDLSNITNWEYKDENLVDIVGNSTHLILPVAYAQRHIEKLRDFMTNIDSLGGEAQKFYGAEAINAKLSMYLGEQPLDIDNLFHLSFNEFEEMCNFQGTYSAQSFSILEKLGSAFEPYLDGKLWGIEGVSSKLFPLSFFSNEGIFILSDASVMQREQNYYEEAVETILLTDLSYEEVESEWLRTVPLWQLHHYFKNSMDTPTELYAEMSKGARSNNPSGSYVDYLAEFLNSFTGEDYNAFFNKWKMKDASTADLSKESLVYYTEDTQHIFADKLSLSKGMFMTIASRPTLFRWGNYTAAEVYEGEKLVYVELFYPDKLVNGVLFKIDYEQFDSAMKIRVIGGENQMMEAN